MASVFAVLSGCDIFGIFIISHSDYSPLTFSVHTEVKKIQSTTKNGVL